MSFHCPPLSREWLSWECFCFLPGAVRQIIRGELFGDVRQSFRSRRHGQYARAIELYGVVWHLNPLTPLRMLRWLPLFPSAGWRV